MSADGDGIVVTGHAQREAWLARTLPPVEQLAADLWSIPVPMPSGSPLRYVSVYAFAVPGGLVLIDAGWGSDQAWEALGAGLAAIGAAVTDVRGVLVTHLHFDHLGLADRVRRASGAWVALHEDDLAVVTGPSFRDARAAVAADHAHLRHLGASAAEAERVGARAEAWEQFTRLAPPDRVLRDGDPVDAPGWSLRTLHTPGHTPGHVCFVEPRLDTVFSGDHVLPRITPNISVDTFSPADPLGDYLASLQRVAALPVTHVAPAHEWRFDGLAARTAQIAEHHDRRLAEVVAAVHSRPGSTPWDIAGLLTWSRPWDQYDGRMRVFAVTETASHVVHLEATGVLVSSGGDVPRYTVATVDAPT